MTFDDFGIEIQIPGKPLAQKRPKFRLGRNKQGRTIPMAYNSQDTEAGKFMHRLLAAVRHIDPKWMPVAGAVELDLVFEMPIPASTPRRKAVLMEASITRHTKKPDLDNLCKFVKDCATGVLWNDDSQVDKLKACKEYAVHPCTHIRMRWDGKGESDGR
jgi:Holliday junction resolvase RusA-like endonuclease